MPWNQQTDQYSGQQLAAPASAQDSWFGGESFHQRFDSFSPWSLHAPNFLHDGGACNGTGFGTPSAPTPLLSPHPATPQPFQDARAPEYSIFVGDLSPDITEEDLVNKFLNPPAWPASHPAAIQAAQAQQAQGNFTRPTRIGPAPFHSTKSAKIMTDPVTNVSRGYGFVRFGDEADCNRALVEMQGIVIAPSKGGSSGRPLRVCTATPKERGASGQANGSAASAGGQGAHPASADGLRGQATTSAGHALSQQQSQQLASTSGLAPTFGGGSGMSGFCPPSFFASSNGNTGVGGANSAGFARFGPATPQLQVSPYGAGTTGTGGAVATSFSNGLASSAIPSEVVAGGALLRNAGGGANSPLPIDMRSAPASAPASGVAASDSTSAALAAMANAANVANAAAAAANCGALDETNTTVFVGGLSSLISEDTLRTFFSPFGDITYVKIPPGKGCGFVQFVRKVDAARAIERMQSFPIGGGRIRLSWGRSQGDKAAAAAAIATEQAARFSQIASMTRIGTLTQTQLAQLADAFAQPSAPSSAAGSATTATGAATMPAILPSLGGSVLSTSVMRSPSGSESSLPNGTNASVSRQPLTWPNGTPASSAATAAAAVAASIAAPGGKAGAVAQELTAIFVRLNIDSNPKLAQRFLELARSAEAELLQAHAPQADGRLYSPPLPGAPTTTTTTTTTASSSRVGTLGHHDDLGADFGTGMTMPWPRHEAGTGAASFSPFSPQSSPFLGGGGGSGAGGSRQNVAGSVGEGRTVGAKSAAEATTASNRRTHDVASTSVGGAASGDASPRRVGSRQNSESAGDADPTSTRVATPSNVSEATNAQQSVAAAAAASSSPPPSSSSRDAPANGASTDKCPSRQPSM